MGIPKGLLLVEAYIGVEVVWDHSMRHCLGLSCFGMEGFVVERVQG